MLIKADTIFPPMNRRAIITKSLLKLRCPFCNFPKHRAFV
ncbi:hypothetical protein BURMUCGD1_3737 [Burkholderia multivorans CGD1]|nr:hypothetical protein BURMUCGD1_3737 [Burkholderia multivorans CGD1]